MNIQTHFSILESLESPKNIVKICKKYGYDKLVLCDTNRLSGLVEFYEACKKNEVKPIFGIQLKICTMDATIKEDYNLMYNLCLIAKNKNGFRNILKILSLSNDKEKVLPTEYQNIPRCTLEDLKDYTEDVIAVLANDSEYSENKDEYTLAKYKNLFKEVYTDEEIYWANVKYLTKDQYEDWQIQQCIHLKCTLEELPSKIREVGLNLDIDYSLPLYESYKEDKRFELTDKVLASIEEFNILQKPQVPKFDCPDGMPQKDYLTELCRNGWRRRFPVWTDEKKKQEYAERVKYELSVLQGCDLDGYFLVVQDYINWCKRQGWLIGCGRGCVDKDTKVITLNDIKPISEIKIGDYVLSRNGTFNQVKNTFVYDTDEEMLNIKTAFSENKGITVTKDHKVLVTRSRKDINLEWIRADELQIGHYMFFPNMQRKTEGLVGVDLSHFTHKTFATHNDTECFYKKLHALTGEPICITSGPRFITADDDFYFFLGLFTSNGKLYQESQQKVSLYLKSDKPEDVKRIIQFLDKNKIKFYKTSAKRTKITHIYIKHWQLAEYLRTIFNGYKNNDDTRHVPLCIKDGNNSAIYQYLEGFIAGIFRKKTTNYLTVRFESLQLYKDIKYLLYILGVKNDSHMLVSNRSTILFSLPRLRKYQESLNIGTAKDIGYGHIVAVEDISQVSGIDKVYDISVENEQNYVTLCGTIHNSSGGSLVAYLLGITEIDPIPNGLYFERFYSVDRAAGEMPSLPDIDTDFPKNKREYVVKYIEDKIGKDKVVHISNFATLKGSGALTAVLKAHDIFDHNMIKSITKKIPSQDKVIDRMSEESEDSLIRFVLRFMPDILKILGSIEGDKIVGEYAYHLEQAIRLEGVIRNTGVHASGILISNEVIEDMCPLAIDNDCTMKIAGVEMKAAEKLGLVKVDILGLKCLDKLMEIQKLLLGESEDQ